MSAFTTFTTITKSNPTHPRPAEAWWTFQTCCSLLGMLGIFGEVGYLVISKRICVVSPKFYTARKNFTGPPVPTNFKSDLKYFKYINTHVLPWSIREYCGSALRRKLGFCFNTRVFSVQCCNNAQERSETKGRQKGDAHFHKG